MRLRGLHWAALGLVVGVMLGFGVIQVKRLIRQAVLEGLNDEAKIACDCQVKIGDMDISL